MRARSSTPTPQKARWAEVHANDRRRSQRLYVCHPGRLLHKERWVPIVILDLSGHGLRILGAGSFKAGDHVSVELAAPCRSLCLDGRVVWNDHGRKRMAGIGLHELAKPDALALNATLLEAVRGSRGFGADVLVVTEDPSAQLTLAHGIWAHELEVAVRTTVPGALSYLAATPHVRAALVSASLAQRAGPRLIDLLSEHHPHLRRVLLVDNLMAAGQAFGTTLPHFALLSPFRGAELSRALRGALP